MARVPPNKPPEKRVEIPEKLTDVTEVGDARSETLAAAGYRSPSDLRDATFSELTDHVPGDVAEAIKRDVGYSVAALAKGRITPDVARRIAKRLDSETDVVTMKVDGRQRGFVLRTESEDGGSGCSSDVEVTIPPSELQDIRD